MDDRPKPGSVDDRNHPARHATAIECLGADLSSGQIARRQLSPATTAKDSVAGLAFAVEEAAIGKCRRADDITKGQAGSPRAP